MRLTALTSLMVMFLLSCNSGSNIEGGSYGNKGTSNKTETDPNVEPLDSTKSSDTSDPIAIEFPVLGMSAKGTTFCKEALGTSSTIETKLFEEKLELKRVAVRVDCYKQSGPFGSGACNQSDFDQKINGESLGTTVFTRATKKQLDQMKENGGIKAPSYAILATKAQTHKGLQYEFSSPLPIFPWPASKARYEAIDGVEQEFSADVTGEKNVSVKMSVKMIDSTDTTATLQFTLTINGSEERSLYDKFPIPRTAVYTVNTETKDVRTIESTDWFYDKECPQNGQASLTYKLCSKTKNSKTENFPCN